MSPTPGCPNHPQGQCMRVMSLLASILLAHGCQFDPNAHLYTAEKPRSSDVIGRYTLTSQTVVAGDLVALQGNVCSIDLQADGTFVATNVPPAQTDFPTPTFFTTLVDGAGTWKIERCGSVGSLDVWGISLNSPTTPLESVGLTGTKSPYGLIYTLGDPDSGEAMIFERAP